MGDAWEETEEPYPRAGHAHIRVQFQMASVSAGLSLYSVACATDGSTGSKRGPLFGFSLSFVLRW